MSYATIKYVPGLLRQMFAFLMYECTLPCLFTSSSCLWNHTALGAQSSYFTCASHDELHTAANRKMK